MARTTKKAAAKTKAGAAKSPAGKAKPADKTKAAAKRKDLSKRKIAAPKLAYQPRDPRSYRPNIGLIACGGITSAHLRAYKAAGYKVVALCDLIEGRAVKRQEEFYPKADVYVDYRDVLARPDIEVVDIATHPKDREELLEAAQRAGKHVLSQKPFVLDLDFGRRLIKLADRKSVKLAVNQNGRWAPHFAYLRTAIAEGLIGEVFAAHLCVHWNHNWVKGRPFDKIRHCILYDFAIHWFDILNCFMGAKKARKVYASWARSPGQIAAPKMLAQVGIEYDNAQATLVFDADVHCGDQARNYIAGTAGTLVSGPEGDDPEQVTLYTPRGFGKPKLLGRWFPDGFHGTMGELLRAIEEDREPYNSARHNLESLALCFAAVASAETGQPVKPGTIKRLEPGWM